MRFWSPEQKYLLEVLKKTGCMRKSQALTLLHRQFGTSPNAIGPICRQLRDAGYLREFDGVISGITRWGAYVELENTIEGLVHVTNMYDDHYEYFEEQYELIGAHTRNVYKLGQPVRVRVLGVDRLQRTMDFEFCEADSRQQSDRES